jgi:hypothetical protein
MKLAVFLEEYERLTEEQFIAKFEHGFLLVNAADGGDGNAHREFETKLAQDHRALFAGCGEEDILPLVKKGGAQSFTMITVGRTSRNDIVFENEAVSKFHAYFKRDRNGRHMLCDPGSTNGTKLDGKVLEKDSAMTLHGGETVVFGNSVNTTFHTAATLYRALGVLRRWM